MAVDTKAKRLSMLGFGSPIPSMVHEPAASVGKPQRADLLYLYAGITLATEIVQAIPHLFYTLNGAQPDYTLNGAQPDYILKRLG